MRVQTAAHDLGTGAYTVIGQMAAERLGVLLGSVTVELGDSRLPVGPVAGGSNTTASTCSAVMKACDAIRRKLFHSAATAEESALAGRDPAQLTLRNRQLVAHDGAAEDLEEAFRRLEMSVIEEYAEFNPRGAPPDAVKNLYAGKVTFVGGPEGEKMMYAMGAEIRRSAGARIDAGDSGAAHCRRLCSRAPDEHAYSPQSIDGRNDLGNRISVARSDRDRSAQRPLRERQSCRL